MGILDVYTLAKADVDVLAPEVVGHALWPLCREPQRGVQDARLDVGRDVVRVRIAGPRFCSTSVATPPTWNCALHLVEGVAVVAHDVVGGQFGLHLSTMPPRIERGVGVSVVPADGRVPQLMAERGTPRGHAGRPRDEDVYTALAPGMGHSVRRVKPTTHSPEKSSVNPCGRHSRGGGPARSGPGEACPCGRWCRTMAPTNGPPGAPRPKPAGPSAPEEQAKL
jgi:hypothetical protein